MAGTHQISLPMEATPQAPPPLEETPQTLSCVQPQRTAPLEATQQEKPVGKQRRGRRRKIPMQRIQHNENRLVTFSKRRVGIYKKAAEISTLCGAEVGILMFSPAGKPYAYGVPNVESITDRFLRGVNPGGRNDNLSRIVKEAQRKANVGKLNNDCDVLSVYLQNLQVEGEKLKKLKKQTSDGGCWWDIPVEDLNAEQMQGLKAKMEEIKKKASKRLRDLRVGASSSSAVVQPEDIQMGINGGFGFGDGRIRDFMEGGLSSAVAGVHGGVMQMGGNLGQGYGAIAGGSGGFGDWRAGGLVAAGNLGGFGGLGDWGASSSVQAGGMQMSGKWVTGHGGGVVGGLCALTVGGSSSARIQQGSMQVGGYGGGVSGGGGVAGGGVGGGVLGGFGALTVGSSSSARVQQGGRQVGEYGGGGSSGGDVAGGGIGGGVVGGFGALTVGGPSSAMPTVGSMLVGGNLGRGYAGSAGGSGGFGDFRAGGSTAAGIQGGGFQQGGNGGLGGLGDWVASSSVKAGGMQMGGIGGSGFGGGVGGGFTAGASAASAQQGGVQVGEYGGGGFGQWKPVELSAGWKPVNSSSTFNDIQASNPMKIGRDGGFGNLGGTGAGGGGGGGRSHDNWRSVGLSARQMGGIVGFGHDVGGSTAGGGLGGWGVGGASSSSLLPKPMQMSGNGGLDFGGFGGVGNEFGGGGGLGDVAAGSSAAAAIDLDEDQMGGTSNGGSFYDGGDGSGTNNRFGGFLYDGGSKFI